MLSQGLRYVADSLEATADSGLDLSPRSQREVADVLRDYARWAHALEQAPASRHPALSPSAPEPMVQASAPAAKVVQIEQLRAARRGVIAPKTGDASPKGDR